VNAITKTLARELGPRKIRVNAIIAGMIETEGLHSTGIVESDFRQQVEAQTPLGANRSAAGHRSGSRFSCLA